MANPHKNASGRKHWKIWKTIDQLEQHGLRCDSDVNDTETNRKLIQEVSNILRLWGDRWGEDDEWQSILNKSTLLHEIEESILALGFLMDFIKDYDTRSNHQKDSRITIVDVCCGKGIFSMLASYVFQNQNRVDKIIMLDNGEINWDHCQFLNKSAVEEGRPLIETWKCNLHDIDQVVDRLSISESSIAMIGIHLCKTLTPSFIGIANQLSSICPFFVLAPCCLPRAVLQSKIHGKKSVVKVLQYETPIEKNERYIVKHRRDAAMKRAFSSRPLRMVDQVNLLQHEAEEFPTPCWKCGNLGHFKANCPSTQTTGKPKLLRPPEMEIDVSDVLRTKSPFDTYCNLLVQSIQYSKVRMVDAGLVNDSVIHQAENWNGARKSIYIVANDFK